MYMPKRTDILVAGFPYVRERYFATWRHVPEPERYHFLLPRRWTAKNGSVIFTPPEDARVMTAQAYFHDSHAPIIGGLLKGWMPAFPLVLWRLRNDVGLVYSCSEPTLLTTLYQAACSALLGKKHVCFTWENIPYERKMSRLSYVVHRVILWAVLALSDGLICGNPESAEIHRRYTKKRMVTIPMNGIDAEFFRREHAPKKFQDHDWSGNVVYTFIGAIGKRKGLDGVLEAFEGVLRAVDGAVLVIAGRGEYEDRLSRIIEQCRLQDAVVRFGWLDDVQVRELLNVSDVFLYPSIPTAGWAEQFGYSMAEASLMELPVVATRSGSIAHVVRDGETGLLVAPGNVLQLTAAMVRLGNDTVLREHFGTAGRQYVSEHFSHREIARQFASFFAAIQL